MEFRNHTPFPALLFEGIDPHSQHFHVLALRQTLTWDDDGKLAYSDEQAPLNLEDQFFAEAEHGGVREESDLCHYKPHCDVIINTSAHAPKGQPTRQFTVRLRLSAPNKKNQKRPKPPQGLNPLQSPSEATQQAWQARCEAMRKIPPEEILIDKTLTVTGERWFKRRLWPRRLLANLIRWGSLGVLRPTTWRLSRAQKTLSVPIRADLAFGGQCEIKATDKAAKRVPKRHRLKPAALPGIAALEGLQGNPSGRGWVRHWYLKAKRLKRLPAPQIEHPGCPVKLSHFTKAQRGRLKDNTGTDLIAGLGIRHKGHPARTRLSGTLDETFINGKNALPPDFDFAVWNAAWPDQQTRHLTGNEHIELTNLCHPNATGVRYDREGNTVLRLTLPQHTCFALLRFHSGEMYEHPLAIDTLIIEPDTQRLSLVWRAKIEKDPAHPIRVVEAQMQTFAVRDRLNAAAQALQQITRQAVNA
jgi:hypothetical protein